jgi:hypothetical protein
MKRIPLPVKPAELGPGGAVSLLVLNHKALAQHAFVVWVAAIRLLRIGLAAIAATAARIAKAGERL